MRKAEGQFFRALRSASKQTWHCMSIATAFNIWNMKDFITGSDKNLLALSLRTVSEGTLLELGLALENSGENSLRRIYIGIIKFQ